MTLFIKNFLGWFHVKPKIDTEKHKPPFVKEGEMWWFHCGENIGAEISGKGDGFTRPGIIYKKLSQYLFLIIPASTKKKTGTWFSSFSFNKENQIACLHQIKIIDYRRLYRIIGELSEKDFKKVQKDLHSLYF